MNSCLVYDKDSEFWRIGTSTHIFVVLVLVQVHLKILALFCIVHQQMFNRKFRKNSGISQKNSLLEIGISYTEIRGDPLTDPLRDGLGRTYRTIGVLKKGAIPPFSDTITRIGQSEDSSGP